MTISLHRPRRAVHLRNLPREIGMTLHRLRSCALAILLLAAPAAGQAAETPTATVPRLNAALLETMKNAEATGYRGRYEKPASVRTETFDFTAMAKARQA